MNPQAAGRGDPGARDYGAELQHETRRWRERLRARLAPATATDVPGEGMLTNIRAYDRDSEHFERSADHVRAFECVLWAWAWLEIGERLGHVRTGTS